MTAPAEVSAARRDGAGVAVEEVDGCLVIAVERPEVRNALDADAAARIDAALRRLERDDRLRVGVLTGRGGHFSAGKDIKAAVAGRPEGLIAERGFAGLTRAVRGKPLIAAVEGYALGGGCELALACDLVVAGASARFGLPEVCRGLVAPEGGLVRLPRRIPPAIAAELLLTGRQLDAVQAHRWGLANRIVPDGEALAAALALAAEIGRNAPLAVRTTLRVLRECAGLDESAAFARQDALVPPVFASADAAEGLAAFAEHREPRWTGR
jgi:enoyl-CoA hydratase